MKCITTSNPVQSQKTAQITKICKACGIEKPTSEFGKRTKSKSGFSGTCKKCYNARTTSRRRLLGMRPLSDIRVKVEYVDGKPNRKCSKCGVLKPFDEYYVHSGSQYGIVSMCKQCCLDRARQLGVKQKHIREMIDVKGITYYKCSKCGEFKSPLEFGYDARHECGLTSECRVCKNKSDSEKRRKMGVKPQRLINLACVNGIKYKECSVCKQSLPISNFSKDKIKGGSACGVTSQCKACHAKLEKQYNKCARHAPCSKYNIKRIVTRTCPVCGKEFTHRAHVIEYRERTNVSGKAFCSHLCADTWNSSKTWQQTHSPYAKKIKELQKVYK